MYSFKRLIASVLILCTTLMGLPLTAHAALVGTEEALTSTVATAERGKVDAFMQREDVRAALQSRGVSPEEASERVRALSQDEVSQLALQIDQAPAAGADVLGFFLVLFVVLLITDVLGMTKVFPFTRTMR